jgi:hypothetical protein
MRKASQYARWMGLVVWLTSMQVGSGRAATFTVELINLPGNPLNQTVQVQVFDATGDVDVPLLRPPVTVNRAFRLTINVLDPGAPTPTPSAGVIDIPTSVKPQAVRLVFSGQGLRSADLNRLENSNHTLRVPLPVDRRPCLPPCTGLYYYRPTPCWYRPFCR